MSLATILKYLLYIHHIYPIIKPTRRNFAAWSNFLFCKLQAQSFFFSMKWTIQCKNNQVLIPKIDCWAPRGVKAMIALHRHEHLPYTPARKYCLCTRKYIWTANLHKYHGIGPQYQQKSYHNFAVQA